MSIEDTKELTMEEALALDQEEKKEVVIKTLANLSAETSEFEDIRKIAEALRDGDQLNTKIVSGGKTNYAYKVYLEASPEIAVFAKICFAYALWNPDRSVHYDLMRVENEFITMKRFQEMMGGKDAPVATPYFCVDVPGDMKVIFCQWSPDDEQLANQFIDGDVDERVIPKIARALAILNTAEVDPMFNDNVRPCMRNIFPLCKSVLDGLATAEGEPIDKTAMYCKEIGPDGISAIFDKLDEHYMRREALIHSDPHVFNILVERKPDISKLAKFGDKGNFVLCDWEMVFAGPIGRDVGIFQGYPLACAFAHAMHGRKKEAYHMFDCNVQFFDAYMKSLIEDANKDEQFVKEVFRSSMGWITYFTLLGYYILNLNMDCLPTEGFSESDLSKVRGSLGYTGFKLAEYGFLDKEPDLSLEELRARYKQIIASDIEELLLSAQQDRRRPSPRRASMLRVSGRRVSDASAMEEAAEWVRRVSLNEKTKNSLKF